MLSCRFSLQWARQFHKDEVRVLCRWSFGCLCGCLLIVNATFTLLSPIFPQVNCSWLWRPMDMYYRSCTNIAFILDCGSPITLSKLSPNMQEAERRHVSPSLVRSLPGPCLWLQTSRQAFQGLCNASTPPRTYLHHALCTCLRCGS